MKDFQTVTAAAADRIGGFFAGLRTRITERTDEGDGTRIARILRRFFAAVAPAAFAALLGSVRLPLSTYPLGLAAVAAGVGDTPALAVGVLLGALFAGNVPSLAGVIVLVTLRLIFSLVFDPRRAAPVRPRLFTKETCSVLFREGEALRVCSAAVAAFTAGMVRLFAGGFAIGDLVGVCFAVLICPALTYLYIGYTTATAHSSPRFVIGHAALLVSFVFALSSLSLPLGFSAATAVAAYLSMLAARRRDPLAAGVLALLFGFAAVPAASPGTAVAALLFSMLCAHIPVWLAAAAGVDGGGIEDGGKVVDDVGSVEDEGAPNTTRQGAIHGP
mgnify:CR=1 FL=1